MCDVAEKISDEDLAHGFVALEAKLFAEGSVRFAGRVLGVDGALEFAPAPADLGALVFQAGGAFGWGVAGSSGSEAKAGVRRQGFFSGAACLVDSLNSKRNCRRHFSVGPACYRLTSYAFSFQDRRSSNTTPQR